MSVEKKRSPKNIAGRVKELIEGTINELGYVLWDVEYVKEGAEWYLRITIDNENGININDCEKVHMTVSPMLDEADPIENSYRLEVSSPGIERDLKNKMHYQACIGCEVEVRLFTAFEGRKVINGILVKFDEVNNTFEIEENGNSIILDKNLVSKIKTVYNFE